MSSKCQRCARAGRECVYTVHSKTRRRKRTDTRVKELEEKVKSLSLLLEQGKGGSKSGPMQRTSESLDVGEDDMDDDDEGWSEDDEGDEHLPQEEDTPDSGGSRNFDGYAAFKSTNNGPGRTDPAKFRSPRQGVSADNKTKFVPTGSISPDVVEKGLLSMDKAQELFDRYVEVLSPNYPAIYFPPGTSAATIRKQRPVL